MGEKAKFVSIQFTMRLPLVITKKANWYASYCPVLDVASQGVTEEEARKNLSEALFSFLISCHERGVLDAVLKDCGFVPDYSSQQVPPSSDDSEYIDVPLPFIIDMGNADRCHA